MRDRDWMIEIKYRQTIFKIFVALNHTAELQVRWGNQGRFTSSEGRLESKQGF
jgi:hypothetical protein